MCSVSGCLTRMVRGVAAAASHPRGRPERHFRENTPAESGDGFDGGFVEALSQNSNGVFDAFRIGE
jgi:hypothetical protein